MKLVKYDAARKALAEAHRVDEAKQIRDKAVAIVAYARQVQDRDMITWASEIKVRAERRMGELLRETAKAGQRQAKGRPAKNGGGHPHLPTLRRLGISSDQAKDAQRLAQIPEPEFEQRLAHASRDPRTMTTSKLLRPIPKPVTEDPFAKEKEVWARVIGWLNDVKRLPSVERLRSVRPTGGLRTSLGGYFGAAKRYMADLECLEKEGWF